MLSHYAFNILFAHDLVRPAFARRSIERNDKPAPGLRAGGKPVPTFRDHALSRRTLVISPPILASPIPRMRVIASLTDSTTTAM
jgi:hypothetical protein